MSERTVLCSKYKDDLPALSAPPFKGDLGEKIFNHVSQRAWSDWKEMEIKVINEYRLVLADPAQYQQLLDTMQSYLGLTDGGEVPTVGDSTRGGS